MKKKLMMLLYLVGFVFAFQAKLLADPPLYMVVYDLDKTEWKVRYTNDDPDLTDDACRTTELWLRYIPAGKFKMGSPTDELGRSDNETRHEVTLTQPFYIGVFECTQRQWELVKGNRPSIFRNDDYYATRPVENVSYNMIRGSTNDGVNWPKTEYAVAESSFMGILRAGTGLTFDLPTEAQWEYACRAGTTTALNSGKDLEDDFQDTAMDEVGRYCYNGGAEYAWEGDTTKGTAKVGSYRKNNWGLYDMHGNVLEWCLDWSHLGPYDATAAEDPKGDETGDYRVCRGGYWHSTAAKSCRSAYRASLNPMYGNSQFTGFRVLCLSMPPEKYSVTVVNGVADKAAAIEGETVTITANMPASGMTFDKWTGSGVAFDNTAAPVTTFEMPAKAVTVKATFKKLPAVKTYKIVVVNGKADKAKAAAGETVTLTANAAPAGKVFDKWTGGAVFEDATSPTTTFVMPAKAVTPKALYKKK